jgi:hypothetical protein
MKIRPLGAELFHAERQTDMTMIHGQNNIKLDMTKLTVVFHNIANAPKH